MALTTCEENDADDANNNRGTPVATDRLIINTRTAEMGKFGIGYTCNLVK